MAERVLAYFVRHGPTAANEKGVFRGWRNYPLGDIGREKARDAGRYLWVAENTGPIISSDLSRASETAEIISKWTGRRVELTTELRPWNVGDFAGKDKKKYQPKLDEYRNNPDRKIPGGESLDTFRNRFRDWFIPFINRAGASGNPPVAVTSASDIHEVANILHGDLARGEIDPGGVAAVVVENGKQHLRILTGRNNGKGKSVS